jgi:spore germination cell wall hydrolase CwlJ-like protein
MVALRTRPRGAEFAPFGLAALLYLLGSTSIGYQDLAEMTAPQPSAAARWREHSGVSPFGTIQAAAFSFRRPVGTHIPVPPDGFHLARFDAAEPEITNAIPPAGASRSVRPSREVDPIVFPTVNRSSKGDRLLPGAAPEPRIEPEPGAPLLPDLKPAEPSAPIGPGAETETDELEAAARFEPFPEYDISLSLELHPAIPTDTADGEIVTSDIPPKGAEETAKFGTARIYFDGGPMGVRLSLMEPWAAGEAPILMVPRAPSDPDLKRSATATPGGPGEGNAKPDPKAGVTIAGKGEVTGEGRRPKSPAEHLGLQGKARAKAERCLANAIYFEARSEPVRGQIAVAQVVLNRAFSSFYPEDICGVVYQNANRHLSCQFTFACDGIPDVVTEPEEWERAKRIARETLDGKLWLKEVGKSTHYHASYVYPYWVRSMRKLTRIGLHTFYRPRAWGDGSDEISWGSAVATAEAARVM